MALLSLTNTCKETIDAWSGIQSAPSKENRKHPQGIQVLQNKFIEKYLGRSHWIMPGVWFLPVAFYCLYHSMRNERVGVLSSVGLAVIGFLLWTLIEYLLHRFVFHMHGKSGLRKLALFMAHGYHHEFPNDPGRLVAPPLMSWPPAFLFAGLFYFTTGPYWLSLFAGLALGYLAYDWIHYYTHHAKPTTRIGKYMRRFHLEHHYKNHDTQFGISSPLWDLAFGTYRSPSTEPALHPVESHQ